MNTVERKKTENKGPTIYEIEYLQQLGEELEIFLRSKAVSTIKDIQLGFTGADYNAQMRISRQA